MPDSKDHHFVNFRYQVPQSGQNEAVLVAVVCVECGLEADDKKKFPVIEALINARIIRVEHSDMMFTPKDRKDEV